MICRLIRKNFYCLAILILLSTATQAEWRAGIARTVITPEQPMWMSGYASRTKPAEGKLHDLWAKALVIEDQAGNRAVLITLDIVGISRPLAAAVCDELQKRHGLQRQQIAINCSHTHCGPATKQTLAVMFDLEDAERQKIIDYSQALQAKIVAVVDEAISHRAPATLTYSNGTTDFAVNRRNNKATDVPELRAAGKLQGPVDHAVPVLVVRDKENRVRAVVCGYACHATTLQFFQWCGDYPGFACLALERAFPDATAFFWAGCGGDQNPLPRSTVELAEEYGSKLARTVEQVVGSAKTSVTGPLAAAYREVPLAFDTLPTRSDLETQMLSKNKYEVRRAKLLAAELDAGRPLSPTYPYPVQTWRVGNDLRWVFLGGEVVVDYSLAIKTGRDAATTWIAGYSNDVMAYIPSRRVLAEGGYEGGGAMIYYGLPTIWAPTVEATILDEVRRQLK